MYICLRTFCNRSASALVVADQTFMVGPGVSPVLAKLVSQIVASKYVDLCDLLPANLQVKEPEPQLQLFNFHAAGASVHLPSSNDSSDWKLTGSSGSIVVCKSWHRGRCTSPLAICPYAHRCSSCFGLHYAAACPTLWPKHPREDGKRRASSPSAASSSLGSKSRRA